MAVQPAVAVVGLTATGKTEWGLRLAEELDGEVIGADSRQVYRRLQIGTTKPTDQERARVPHHVVDQVEPNEQYHLAGYVRDARAALQDLAARGKRPIGVGGTGQYTGALLEGWSVPEVEPDIPFRVEMTALARQRGPDFLHERLAEIDPVAAERIEPNNARRVIRALEVWRGTGRPISEWYDTRDPLDAVIVAPEYDLAQLDLRIDARVDRMFEAGLVAEVQGLLEGGLAADAPGLQSIGYRQVVPHCKGETTLAEAIEATKLATRQLARSQAKWFRRADPRIEWCADLEQARSVIEERRPQSSDSAR